MQTYFLLVLGFLTFLAVLVWACIVFLNWLLGAILCVMLFFASLILAAFVMVNIK